MRYCHRRLPCQYRLITHPYCCMLNAICKAALASASAPLGEAPHCPGRGRSMPLVTLTTLSLQLRQKPAEQGHHSPRSERGAYSAKNGLFCLQILTCPVFWKLIPSLLIEPATGKNLFFRELAKKIGSVRRSSASMFARPYTGERFLSQASGVSGGLKTLLGTIGPAFLVTIPG